MTTAEFINEIGTLAVNKPTNSDIYTVEMAEFVDTFGKIAVPEHFKHLFFVSGGALAIENGLKTGLSPLGFVYTYRKASKTRLIYDFNQITNSDMASIISFITSTAGDWLKLTDWNTDVWKVKIMSNPLRFTETRGSQACRFRQLRLEIEGTKV